MYTQHLCPSAGWFIYPRKACRTVFTLLLSIHPTSVHVWYLGTKKHCCDRDPIQNEAQATNKSSSQLAARCRDMPCACYVIINYFL